MNTKKCWRYYDPNTNRTYASRNVVFDKASSWWKNKVVLLDTQELQEKLQFKLKLDSSQEGGSQEESEEPKSLIDGNLQESEDPVQVKKPLENMNS
ncbi:hypothetical protein LIER_30896 [Lithospermum erythrorhizon]|uniref:Retroviral polymerase SH3-like domain-containing protein n=1 Tax=Lithospermum erythrorhizon TaxID=34254 RepID=A0AAV3RSF4_LITER